MKARIIVLSTLATGFVAAAPAVAQRPGQPPAGVRGSAVSRPGTASAKKWPAPPLPQEYARKFGTGAAGAKAAKRVLDNEKATREERAEALDALTYYGPDGGRALGAAALRLEPDAARGSEAAGPLLLAVVIAMSKVPERANVAILSKLAETGKEPRLRVAALNGLTELVTSAGYEGSAGGDTGRVVFIYGEVSPGRSWHSLGDLIQSADFEAIKGAMQRTRPSAATSPDERNAWQSFAWWLDVRGKANERVAGNNTGGAPPDSR